MATVPAQRVEVAGVHTTTMDAPAGSTPAEKRRLIVACDGSWLNADADETYLPSNIARLARALNTNATSPNPTQVMFYHRGLGANDDGKEDYYLGGYLGKDISEHVLECYSFLCTNYQDGDEVFLLGFSRGAYTARAISGLIANVGFLTVRGLDSFYEIFEDFKNQALPQAKDLTDHHTPVRSGLFKGLPQRPKMATAEYVGFLASHNLTRPDVPIKAVGVFDTVGGLGLPPLLGIGKPSLEFQQYSFVNTQVAPVVEYAFQAISLDDHRFAFMPCVWEVPQVPNKLISLQQCWFPGVHQNIGGGGTYVDQGLPNVTLAWMVQKLLNPTNTPSAQPLLDFDTTYLEWVFQRNITHVEDLSAASTGDHLGFRGWAMGKVNESIDFKYSLAGNIKWHAKSITDFLRPGDIDRTPGRYEEWDATGGEAVKTGKMLHGTNEKIHSCVRMRIAREGKGLDDKGVYAPRGLNGWKLVGDGDKKDPMAKGFKWVGVDSDEKRLVLEEDVLGPFEAKMYALSEKAFAAQGKK